MNPDVESGLRRTRKKRKCTETSPAQDVPQSPKPAITKKAVRARRGALKLLPEMPMDVLFEIFGQLEPMDLVRLTRTSKALRKILLDDSAVFVWKYARSNMPGLPECPEDLKELAYALLVFGTRCMNCNAWSSVIHCWELRTILCVKCLDTKRDRFLKWHSSRGPGSGSFSSMQMPDRKYDVGLVCDCPKAIYKFKSKGSIITWEFRYMGYLEKSHDTFHILDKQGKKQWLSRVCEMTRIRREHGKRCDEWLAARALAHSNTLNEIRDKRVKEIKKRLVDLGWGNTLYRLSETKKPLEAHTLVNQKKELTERIWKNIKPRLIEYLERRKTALDNVSQSVS